MQHNHLDSEQARAATGFSMDISRLLAHTNIETPAVVVVDYNELLTIDNTQKQALYECVNELRKQGYRVTVPLSTDDMPVGVTHRLARIDQQWQLAALTSA